MTGKTSSAGRRTAFVIATSDYEDSALTRLRAPASDADALTALLQDPNYGAYEVTTAKNASLANVTRDIERHCSSLSPSDLLLLYLSCHGLLDSRGRLYYATTDTQKELLSSSALSANWLNDVLRDCRARRQLLVLDCCHSGAYARGAKGSQDLNLGGHFGERGRVVLTASTGTEYAFEGDIPQGIGVSSIFTRVFLQGIRSGRADKDDDGVVTVSEIYEYAYENVRSLEPRQTPQMWSEAVEGELVVAFCRSSRSEPAIPSQSAGAPLATKEASGDLFAELALSLKESLEGCTASLRVDDPTEGERVINARIAGGVLSGQRLRLRGKGREIDQSGRRGDLLVTVRVQSHPCFKIEGNNIVVEIPVSVTEAMLGAVVSVPSPHGKKMSIRVPGGTQSGQVLRISGRGIVGYGKKGDFLVKVMVHIPHIDLRSLSQLRQFEGRSHIRRQRSELVDRAVALSGRIADSQ